MVLEPSHKDEPHPVVKRSRTRTGKSAAKMLDRNICTCGIARSSLNVWTRTI